MKGIVSNTYTISSVIINTETLSANKTLTITSLVLGR